MNPLGITVVLVLLVGVWAQVIVLHPDCDSPEAEEAALVAQDFLNAQHNHGYKYVLNRIEDIKIYTDLAGNNTYVMEVDLLETDCHVLDPTPLANCTVRPKRLTAVEGDCDVVLKKVGGALSVTAFKCKSEESTEDICLGCPTLLPLNDTAVLDFVHASLVTVNNATVNGPFALLEVGRMSSQVVSGGPVYSAEYIIVEAQCSNDTCVPLRNMAAARGFCSAKGLTAGHTVNCRMFATLMPVVDANSTAAAEPPTVHVHTGNLSPKHGLRFHKLTALHNPLQSGHLSAESAESGELIETVSVVKSGADVIVPAPGADVTVPVPGADVTVPVLDPAGASLAPSVAAPNAADPAPADPVPADIFPADPAPADPAPADPAPADPAPADPAPADPAPADDSMSAQDAPSSKEDMISFLFKRDVSAVSVPVTPIDTIVLKPLCPGRVRFF